MSKSVLKRVSIQLEGRMMDTLARYEEALRLIAAPMRPDGTWNRDREACRKLAQEALDGR